jgi:hypothetical protein
MPYPRRDGFYDGHRRYTTFTNWPDTAHVSARDLAIQGFVYSGEGDRVTCVYCGGTLHSWVQGDIIEDEHRRFFAHCETLSYDETSRTEIPADDESQEIRSAGEITTTSAQLTQYFDAIEEERIAEENITQPAVEEAIVCRVCLLVERDTVLLPCFHLVSCASCRLRLENCPVCRQTITGSIKVFLS